MEEKICPECERPIYGRSDKKFCSDGCRNAFNNKQNAGDREMIRKINQQLQKNRRILDEFFGSDRNPAHRDDMLRAGFDFNFYTHITKGNNQDLQHNCYDHYYYSKDQIFFDIGKSADVRLP